MCLRVCELHNKDNAGYRDDNFNCGFNNVVTVDSGERTVGLASDPATNVTLLKNYRE